MSIAALVLAAGLGTRLRPITDEVPKPLVPIGDRPLLVLILENLLELGARELVVNTHYCPEKISSVLKSLSFDVQESHEPRLLGTGGGLRRAAQLVGATSMVLVNGDIWGPLPVQELLKLADLGLTLAVAERPLGQGTVGIGAQGQVVRLRGQCFGMEVRSGDYMGVAHAGQECLRDLPRQGCLIGDYALPQLRAGVRVSSVVLGRDFVDVGTPQQFLAANLAWLGRRQRSNPSEHRFTSFIGSSVQMAPEVRLADVVVGSGAVLEGRGAIERCVIFPKARACAPLFGCIVLPSGRVVNPAAPAD